MKKYDHDSYNRGINAEKDFKKIAKTYGYEVESSTKFENIHLHFDYKLYKLNKTFKIEVKSLKKTSRQDNSTQDKWIWIEFKNVQGNKGWLYGEADYIAFELQSNYIMVNRKDLVKLSEKNINRNKKVNKSKDAKYCCYSRYNRPDELVGMLKLDDIIDPKNNVKYKIWIK